MRKIFILFIVIILISSVLITSVSDNASNSNNQVNPEVNSSNQTKEKLKIRERNESQNNSELPRQIIKQAINQKKQVIKKKKMIQSLNRLNQENFSCPEDCVCSGSTIKCQFEGGRNMTIRAGKSGNTIVQVKEINMSTKVTLYKQNNSLVGIFKGNKTKIIKLMPDQVLEKIKGKIKERLVNKNMTLDENGIFQAHFEKRARFFWIVPVRERVKINIDAETGDIIKIKTSWWGFLARDIKEELVGGCGTVTPGMEDECCQNLGYNFWNKENLECE